MKMEPNNTEDSEVSSDEHTLKFIQVKFFPILNTRSESFQKVFPGYKDGLVRSDPGGFVTIPQVIEHVDVIRNIELRKDDVWLLSSFKTGKLLHNYCSSLTTRIITPYL